MRLSRLDQAPVIRGPVANAGSGFFLVGAHFRTGGPNRRKPRAVQKRKIEGFLISNA